MKLVTTREVCESAIKNNCVAGLFIVKNMEGVQGVLTAAQNEDSPVILGVSGRDFKSIGDLESFILYIKSSIQRLNIPVALHFDHGGEQSIKQILSAIRLGFTGVMYDTSILPLEENIAAMKNVVGICHDVNVSVEGAIGRLCESDCGEYEEGEMEVSSLTGTSNIESYYTIPEEAKIFAEETEVDIVAVSVGTVHGLPSFKVKIDIERLNNIRNMTNALLSIHGGSGTPEEEIIKLIRAGVSKINIGADLYKAVTNNVRELVANNKVEMVWDFRNYRVIEEVAGRYIRLFNFFRK